MRKKAETKRSKEVKRRKAVYEKMTGDNFELEDVELMSEEEAAQYEDLTPDDNHMKYAYKTNPERYWSFAQAYRFMTLLRNWILSSKECVFVDEFTTWVIPRAVMRGDIKPFPSASGIIGREAILNICKRWPYIKEMYDEIRRLQDYKLTLKGLNGEWNANIVMRYLVTHNKNEWTETIKQEIVNKTQILNIDPLEKEE